MGWGAGDSMVEGRQARSCQVVDSYFQERNHILMWEHRCELSQGHRTDGKQEGPVLGEMLHRFHTRSLHAETKLQTLT